MKPRPLYRPEYDEQRLQPERSEPGEYRSSYRRDYARILHSAAFRRLQGKTQLFPVLEHDFFRNRLTHSLEVAQIAKSIAIYLNCTYEYFQQGEGYAIDLDLVEAAALSHDLGLPPFGHRGEGELATWMAASGGFEGNAQTLRILARLEKKTLREGAPADALECGVSESKEDYRVGLNLTVRCLAAILKRDHEMPTIISNSDDGKGYYASEKEIAEFVRVNILRGSSTRYPIRTVECQIMDIADDIAYSTYDLEDALKSGFVTPLSLISLDESTLEAVADDVREELAERFPLGEVESLSADDIVMEMLTIFSSISTQSELDNAFLKAERENRAIDIREARRAALKDTRAAYQSSERLASTGFARTSLTRQLVGDVVREVSFKLCEDCPSVSEVSLSYEAVIRTETLKRLVKRAVVQSPRLKVADYRGGSILGRLVKELVKPENDGKGQEILPKDYRMLYDRADTQKDKRRVLCDFLSGMTDTRALELHSDLNFPSGYTVFRPRS